MQGENNRILISISSKQRIFWCWIDNFSVCQQIHKKNYPPLVRWTAEYVSFIGEAIKIAVSFSEFRAVYLYDVAPVRYITQNMFFQLLNNSKVEINFGWSHPDKSIFWLFASTFDIRKLSKSYLCSQIASRHLSLTSANTLTCCHLETLFSLPQWIKLIICQLLHLFLCKFYLKCLLWFF